MPKQAHFTELMYKFIAGSLTEEENHALMLMLEDKENDAGFDRIMRESFEHSGDNHFWTDEDRASFTTRLMQNGDFSKSASEAETSSRVHRIPFLRRGFLKYAAAFIVVAGAATIAFFLSVNRQETASKKDVVSSAMVIPPGGEHAMLTLDDGRIIVLDTASNGQLANQGGAQVVKLANGQIAYDLRGMNSKAAVWNTLSTPKGGQYQLTLPDGTNVWLNASSSITFPTVFDEKRQVKMQGEVYFEVVQNKHKPFVVDVAGKSSVEVLGTSFNVNSYADEENIKTTLLEGSVKVDVADQTAILKPGQQARIAADGNASSSTNKSGNASSLIVVSSNVNLNQALAWKNGIFDFTGADLKTVMRQLERWYDINVQYKGSASNITFEGKMYMNVHLSDVLEALQEMGVKFELKGKNLIVL